MSLPPVSPSALLIALTLLSAALRPVLLRGRTVPLAAPASVMAIGIFALAALQHLPGLADVLRVPLTIGLLVLWGHMAASFLASAAAGRLADRIRLPVMRFAVGTWVAGTAVLARLIATALPGWSILALVLGGLACAIWIWFLPLALDGIRAILGAPDDHRASGVVLLATVSTQSLATLAFGLPAAGPGLRSAATALVVLGYVLYAVGAALVLRRYLRQRGWRLAEDWENPNCILHGAMSITGLAAVMSGVVPFAFCYGTWLYASAMFLLVEAVELARLVERKRLYGWRWSVGPYHVSQWSRNFTFGMFYAFTLAFTRTFGTADLSPAARAVQAAVVEYGAWVVLALLVIEIALFASAQFRAPIRPSQP